MLQSSSLGCGSFHVSPFPAAGHPDDPDKDVFFICWISQLRSSRGYFDIGQYREPNQRGVLKMAELNLCQYCSGISGSACSILTILPNFSFSKRWTFGAEVEIGSSAAGKSHLCPGFSGWPWIRHRTPPCFPCLWGVLLPTHLLPALGKITIKSLLCFKCCHKNAKDGACGILFGGGGNNLK